MSSSRSKPDPHGYGPGASSTSGASSNPSRTGSDPSKELTKDVMLNAFRLLDDEIGQSELLMSVAPLRLITVGGSLAVTLCGNRKSTLDVDILLDPNVRAADDYWDEFSGAINTVGRLANLAADWMNEDLKTFVARNKMMDLFFASCQASIIIYEGTNLVIYAGDLHWALERKLRRVAYAKERKDLGKEVDLPDAAALIHQIKGGNNTLPLDIKAVKDHNLNTFDVAPDKESLMKVAKYYFEKYGEEGLAEYKQDEAGVMRWMDQKGEWRKVDMEPERS